jgi:ketosteroid isomerase-like protein
VERLERAAEAYNRGDVEPLVALLDEAVDWHGRTRGHLWWKHRLRCHGPEEARANFELRLRKAALRPGYAGVRLDDVREEGDRIMVGATWETDEGKLSELAEQFFQVFTLRDGMIIDIQPSAKAAIAYLSKTPTTKGGREGDQVLAMLRNLGYIKKVS